MRFPLAVAAVSMLAVAACTSSTSGHPHMTSLAPAPSSSALARPYSQVTCTAVAGSASVDRAVIAGRAKRLSPSARISVTSKAARIDLPGTYPEATLSGLCATARLDFRPVIAPPVAVTCGSSCEADPVRQAASTGSFTVPRTDTAYGRLSAGDQSALQAALARYDCARAGSAADSVRATYVACAKGSDYGASSKYVAFLLGPVIVAGTELDTAHAVAATQGNPYWTISLTLKSSGSAAWAAYTGAHNTGGSGSAGSVMSCGVSSVPCADYVGFTLDGFVLSAPVNEAAINGLPTQISGPFTKTSATALAEQLTSGTLQVPLTASVQIVR